MLQEKEVRSRSDSGVQACHLAIFFGGRGKPLLKQPSCDTTQWF